MHLSLRRAGGAGGPGLLRLNAFGASWRAVPVMPVYVPFLLVRGLRVGDVLDVQAVFGLAVTLFEVPTDLLCDLPGRRRTMILGACLNLLGVLGFAAAQGFAAHAAVRVVLAAGRSLVSGADVAMIHDVLDRGDAGRDARRRALGTHTAAQVGGEAAAALAGGLLAAWSLRAVGRLTAAEAVLPLLLAMALADGRLAGSATGLLILGGNSFGIVAPIATGNIVASPLGYSGAFVVAGVLLPAGVAAALLLRRRPIGGEAPRPPLALAPGPDL